MAAARPTPRSRPPGAGYAYLALLFAVVLIGAGLGGAAQVWHTAMQRERERQLLWVGHQYRRAIRLYYTGAGAGGPANAANASQPAVTVVVPSGPQTGVSGQGDVNGTSNKAGTTATGVGGAPAVGAVGARPGGPSRYPPTLDALVVDPRFQQIRRYLRKLYDDPVTGKNDWVPIMAPNGGVMGVHSLSEDTPFKQAGFSPDDNNFTGKTHYSQWEFIYQPPQRGQGPAAPTAPPQVPNYGPAPGIPLNPGGGNPTNP